MNKTYVVLCLLDTLQLSLSLTQLHHNKLHSLQIGFQWVNTFRSTYQPTNTGVGEPS